MSYNFSKYPKEITAKYDVTKKLGHGAYGTVFNIIEKKTKKRMAAKRVDDVFNTTTDARRALREISIMRLCKHPNVVVLKEVYALPDEDTFQNLWVIMEYGGYDLGKIIKHSRKLAGWSELHVRFISWQILAGLNYLHSANIAHRDLKPSNILVTEENHVSLIDFGLARQLTAMGKKTAAEEYAKPQNNLAMSRKLTQHVVTRWYRPPELILMQTDYTAAVDVWSFGCIFGELVKTLDPSARVGPLFPGRTSYPLSRDRGRHQNLAVELAKETHQMSQIFKLIGTPSKAEIAKITRTDIRDALMKRPSLPAQKFPAVFGGKVPAPAIEILIQSLKFDPDTRATVGAMMLNPWFKDVVQKKATFKAPTMKFPFEGIPRLANRAEEKLRLRKLICKEIQIIRDGTKPKA